MASAPADLLVAICKVAAVLEARARSEVFEREISHRFGTVPLESWRNGGGLNRVTDHCCKGKQSAK